MRVKPIVSGKSLRVRYRLSLLASGLLLLAAIAGYGWVSVTNERAVLYTNLQAQGEQLQLSLNEKLDIAQSHVFAMRRSAERSLRHPQLTDSGLAERLRQLSLAAPSDAPWDVLPVELEKEVGSLMVDPTGIDATTYTRDLSAALAMLSEVAATHARHQVFQWSYYYNAQRAWTVIYPKIAREEILQVNRATTMKDALKTLFDEANTAPVTRAGPQRNPERAQVWTAPYLDFGGKGMMVSLQAPVYLAQEFVGVVGTDVTLAMLDTVLQQRPLRLGRALVVDQAGHLLADSQQALKGAQANIRLSDVIAAAPSLLPTREDPAWRQFTLRGTAWTLLLHLPPDVVHAELQTRLRPYFALAVMLVAAILGLAWVQNRRYARPALRLAEYVELLESDAQAPTPRVPTHWQRWFDHLASSVRERRALLAQTQQHASELESKVEQRTADLRRANAELGSAVSALQRTQKQLVRSEKLAALGAMVAGVAHELNTPLGNALLASSTLGDAVQKIQPRLQQGLRKSDLDQFLADVDRAGQLVERNVALASNLVQRFKEVAVHQTREQASRFALFDFTNVVIAGLAPSLRQRPYALVNAIDTAIWLHSYPDALGQVLTHLMGNACTHAFEGRDSGEVRLQAQVIHAEQGARVLLTVQDNGCGIAAGDLPHIFEPFFTTRMGRGGIGLGLHVVLNLVEGVLGGSIEVSSGPAGTVVTLDLPQDCGTHTT